MAELGRVVIEVMGEAYPHIVERRDAILAATEREEAQFARTLDAGTTQLETALAALAPDAGRAVFVEITGESRKIGDARRPPCVASRTILRRGDVS